MQRNKRKFENMPESIQRQLMLPLPRNNVTCEYNASTFCNNTYTKITSLGK